MPQNHIPHHPWARDQHNEAQPPAPLGARVDGLPSATIDIVREEIAKAFQDKLGVSMTSTRQTNRKPYNSRFENVPYPHGTRIPSFIKKNSVNMAKAHMSI